VERDRIWVLVDEPRPVMAARRLELGRDRVRRVEGHERRFGDADPSTGASVYDDYSIHGWGLVGGTSLSAPLIAAVYALASNASRWSYPGKSVYLSAPSLHDITEGFNGSCAHQLQCTAGPGFDLPSGMGTPNGLGGF